MTRAAGAWSIPPHVHLWAWDARPYPYFPRLTAVWSDGENWRLGHWLNGRLGSVPLDALIEAILGDHAFADFAVRDVNAIAGGYLVNEVLSARATLEPLLGAFRIDASDAGERILFRGRTRPADASLATAELVERPDEALVPRRRAQETELASELTLRFIDPGVDYRMAAASSRRLAGQSRRSVAIDLPAVLDFAEAERLAEMMLRDMWHGREEAELHLPPSRLAVDAGDIIALTGGAAPEILLAKRIGDGESRALELRRVDNRMRPPPLRADRDQPPDTAHPFGPPRVMAIDFAPPDGRDAHAPRLAVFAEPWPGRMAVYRGAEGGGFSLVGAVARRATTGMLTAPLGPGVLSVFDRANAIDVALQSGALGGLPDIDVLAGKNVAAVRCADGFWEVLQFAEAELTGPRQYRLTRLLRGQCGTEDAMRAGAETSADFVMLDGAVAAASGFRRGAQQSAPLPHRPGTRRPRVRRRFAEAVIAAEGRGLMPFAPVHLRAKRELDTGDIAVTWIRRTRFLGDSWDIVEVPLNEDREAYRVAVYDGASLLRSVEVDTPRLHLFGRGAGDGFRRAGGAFHAARRPDQRRRRAGLHLQGNRQCLIRHPLPCRASPPGRRRSTSPTTRRSTCSTPSCSSR